MNEEIVKKLLEIAEQDQIQKIVVGALIEKSGKVLLLRRPADDFMGGIFELPSGNLEDGETLFDGLKREVKEETDLEVTEVIDFIDSFDYKSGSGKKVRQFNFYVRVKDSPVRLSEHTRYTWATQGSGEYQLLTDSTRDSVDNFYKYLGEEHGE
jgi:8-oxo-dGTP diphosphatase